MSKVSTPSSRNDAARPPVGILLYLASVGLIAAAIIAVFFGTGFWLLASSGSEMITDSGRDPPQPNGDALKAGGGVVLELAGNTGSLRSATVDVIPDSPLGQDPATAEAAPPQHNNVTQELSPAPANGEPSVETASVAQPGSRAAVPAAHSMPLAGPPTVAAEDSALSAGNRGPSARNGRTAHARTVSQHSRPRSAHGDPH